MGVQYLLIYPYISLFDPALTYLTKVYTTFLIMSHELANEHRTLIITCKLLPSFPSIAAEKLTSANFTIVGKVLVLKFDGELVTVPCEREVEAVQAVFPCHQPHTLFMVGV